MSEPRTSISLVTISEIDAARQIIEPIIRATPIDRSDTFTRIAGRPIILKHEELQRTGSFKIRGAYHHLALLADAQPVNAPFVNEARGVVAASAGNHGQGVALAASLLGIPSTVFMPVGATHSKIEATRGYGAEVHLVGTSFDDALRVAIDHAHSRDLHFVAPYDDPTVIAGQGTLGLELVEQAEEAEVFVIPIGGGGLIAGIAVALKALRPDCRVIGVEAEGAASMTAALRAGQPVTLDHVQTMADGIATRRVSDLTLAHAQAFVDDVVTVSEEELSRTLLLLLERAKVMVEPAGAASLAALLHGKVSGNEPACALLSGGNIDPALLVEVIQHGIRQHSIGPESRNR